MADHDDGAAGAATAGEVPAGLRVGPTPQALLAGIGPVLARLLAGLVEGRSADDPVDLAIAGGFVATDVLPAAARELGALDWSRLRVWWVDERFVAAGDAARNDREARESFLSRAPGVQTRPMPSDDGRGVERACQEYLALWRREMAGRRLDLALLGVGPDGHFASLFPGHPQLDAVGEVLVEDHSPKPPPVRLTLSRGVVTASRRIWVAAAGASKAHALGRALGGADPHEVPAAALVGPRTTWWLDAGAAREVAGLDGAPLP